MKTETKEKLAPGDDVFIRGNNKDTIFYGKDGTVKEVLANGKVIVHFHKNFSHLFGFYYNKGETSIEFDAEDLEKFMLDEEPLTKANRIYYKHYHTLYTRTYKFSPENMCMHLSCNQKAVKRILYNCWGSVAEFDVCEEHDKDGYCGDGFPMKQEYKRNGFTP